jgi:hypothetical protein
LYWKKEKKFAASIESRFRQHLCDDDRDEDGDGCDDETAHIPRAHNCQNSMFSLSSLSASCHSLLFFFLTE